MKTPSITRVEPLRPRGLRVRIHLTLGDPFEVTLEALERTHLGVGDPLPAGVRHNLLTTDADVRVRDAAFNLLSFRARTRLELRKKLLGKGFHVARVEGCLDVLEEKGFLDDQAVAAAFVRDRLRQRPRGPARLSSELRKKGVAGDLAHEVVDRVLKEQEVTELDLALRVAEQWLSRQNASVHAALAGPRSDPECSRARRRLYGFMTRRGFRGSSLGAALDRVAARVRSEAED